MGIRPLVLLAHGSHQPGPSSLLSCTAERVNTILQGVEVRTGYTEFQPPDSVTALEGLVDPVMLSFSLARGYHVVHDVPAAVERRGSGTVAGHLGAEEHLVRVVVQRLYEVSVPLDGITGLDHTVPDAAGSRRAAAPEEIETTTRLFKAHLRCEITPACLLAACPSVRDAVSMTRVRGVRRVGAIIYLLVEGRFRRTLHPTGADVMAASIDSHPVLAELVIHRYREQVV